jgi:hypothetical protein
MSHGFTLCQQVGNRSKRKACIIRDGKQYDIEIQNWDADE